jgi:hypothetical protein
LLHGSRTNGTGDSTDRTNRSFFEGQVEEGSCWPETSPLPRAYQPPKIRGDITAIPRIALRLWFVKL